MNVWISHEIIEAASAGPNCNPEIYNIKAAGEVREIKTNITAMYRGPVKRTQHDRLGISALSLTFGSRLCVLLLWQLEIGAKLRHHFASADALAQPLTPPSLLEQYVLGWKVRPEPKD